MILPKLLIARYSTTQIHNVFHLLKLFNHRGFTLIDCIAATLGVDYIFYSVPLSRSALWEARLLWYILACMYLLVINLLEVVTLWQEVSYAALNAPAIHPASYIDSRAKLLILIIFTSLVAEMQAIMLVHRALKKTLVSSRRNPKVTYWRRVAQDVEGIITILYHSRLCFAGIWTLSRLSTALGQGAVLPVSASTYTGSFDTSWGLIITAILGVYGTIVNLTGVTAIFALGLDLLGTKLRLWPDCRGPDFRPQENEQTAEDRRDLREDEKVWADEEPDPSTDTDSDGRKEKDDKNDADHFPYGVEEKSLEPGKWMLYFMTCGARRHPAFPSCSCGRRVADNCD
jgi:hypothetical protein